MMHLSSYLGLLESGCATLAHFYRRCRGSPGGGGRTRICHEFAVQCDRDQAVKPFMSLRRPRRASPNDFMPTGCPTREAADWDCFAISMICTRWPELWDMARLVVGQAAKGLVIS